ncbi:MAG: aldehyde dehydrogenase family protein, partial [Acidimicrobiales bacterium]
AVAAGLAEAACAYELGDPLDPATTLGPMVSAAAAESVRAQIDAAQASGARRLVGPDRFGTDAGTGSPYCAPEVLVDVDHSMAVMAEETFGPIVGVMAVADDDAAVGLMNDSAYGLSASIWTRDLATGAVLADRVQAGTVFLNRADYLDPALAWTGVKDSGRGATLSSVGFQHLTRPKSHYSRPMPAVRS